jgi:hypothetical protein
VQDFTHGYLHLSFDDVSSCIQNLAKNNYESAFDEPFLALLYSLNQEYGARFSLYCFTSDLVKVPNSYADELFAAREWLKFGLHADNTSSSFKDYSYEGAKASWNEFVKQITRITGSYLSVDRMPRLHTFAGCEAALLGMRDANYGALGFISADDSRLSYYFTDENMEYLYTHNHITDFKNGLTFVATDIRIDWFYKGFTSANNYRAPTKSSLYDELYERFSNPDYANTSEAMIIFVHEWQIYNGTSLNEERAGFVSEACEFARDFELRFSYPQNEHHAVTGGDIR